VKTKTIRLLFLAIGLACLAGCDTGNDYGYGSSSVNIYGGVGYSSFYDPWYGGYYGGGGAVIVSPPIHSSRPIATPHVGRMR